LSVLAFDLFGYDNGGDRTSVDANREWSWETRFWNLGAPGSGRRRREGSGHAGETLMGYSNANGLWADIGFEAAYVSATQGLGPGSADGSRWTISRHRPHQQGTSTTTPSTAGPAWRPIAGTLARTPTWCSRPVYR
jgi:hypothetical protein